MGLIDKTINDDLNKSLKLIEEIELVVKEIQGNEELFSIDVQDLSLIDKQIILEQWINYMNCYNKLNEIRNKYSNEIAMEYMEQLKNKFQKVLLIHSSTIAIRKNSVLLANIIDKNKYLESMLNESRPNFNIRDKQYYHITQEITEITSMISLHRSRNYLDLMVNSYGKYIWGKNQIEKQLLDYANYNYLDVIKLVKNYRHIVFNNIVSFWCKNIFDAWFPFQKWIAISITGVDYSSRKEKYITNEDLSVIKAQLQPGDILLKRNNSQLTNIGLPGFWTHSGIYIGSLIELDKYFQGITLGNNFCVCQYIKMNYPKVYEELNKNNVVSKPYIIEAIALGVVINPLDAIAKVDYFSAVRPKLSKEDKLKALFTSFESLGKGYDYNFDIMTDNALFCSELIYKSYLPSNNKKGLTFNLESKLGRLLLSPNSIIKKFDAEYNSKNSQFDFVVFYDGSERERKAIRKNANDLKITWKRSKWTTLKNNIVCNSQISYPLLRLNSAICKMKIILYGMFY